MQRLFQEVPIRQRFEKMLRYARAEVEAIGENEILSCDIDATTASIVERYRFEFPTLNEAGITARVDPLRQPGIPTQYFAHHYIPFTGERELFRTQPITPPPGAPPSGALTENAEIHIVFMQLSAESPQAKQDFDRALTTIKRYLEALRADSVRLFEQLRTDVKDALSGRRRDLVRAGRLAESLGYPLRTRADAAGIAMPVTRKKLSAFDVPRGNTTKPIALEPHLEEAGYQEILNVLASMSLLIERNPTTFAHMEEELLRDYFLLQLNGRFEGNATGETFNGAGKTDILIRVNDKNIFIAECKFWRGSQSLTDAVDQLFTYLTWRDSKAAVLVFSRLKDFSHTVEEARKTLKHHPQFRNFTATTRETSLRAWMARPDDEKRRIDLTVMLFNIPAAEQPV